MRKFLLLVLSILFLLGVFGCSSSSDVTDSPIPTPEFAPAFSPEPTPTPDETKQTADPGSDPSKGAFVGMYKTCVNTVRFRSSPDSDLTSNIITELGYEVEVMAYEKVGDFTRVTYENTDGYIATDFLAPAGETLYAASPGLERKGQVDKAGKPIVDKDGKQKFLYTELVDMRLYVDCTYDLVFAKEDNVFSKKFYDRPVPLVQKETIKKIQKAVDQIVKEGYTLVVYDAFRPLSIQTEMSKLAKNNKVFPSKSDVSRGTTVCVGLLGSGGTALDLPPLFSLGKEAAWDSAQWTAEQRKNAQLLRTIMRSAGFNYSSAMWWQYTDTNNARYLETDTKFERLTMRTKQYLIDNKKI